VTKRRGHGEGSIRQRSDGRWEGTINIGWRDGKRHRRSVYGQTRREVADKLTSALREHQLGMVSVDERTRTETFLIRWCDESLPGTVKESTAIGYRNVLDRYVIPHIGRIPLAKLGPADVQRMMRTLEDKGLGVSVRRQARVILRRALGEAVRWELVNRNAAALVDAPKGTRHRADALSQEQAATLLAACRGTPLEGIVTVAVATGLRRGEVLGLRWENVDLELRTVTVAGTLKRLPETGLVLDTPKSSTSRRTVPLAAFCVSTLAEHRRHQLEQRLMLGGEWRDTGFVFTTPIGTPLDPRNLTRRFQTLCESAGLGRVRFHALRHTAATLMLNNGVPLEVISATLGHSSYAITADIYAKVAPTLQRGAADTMDGLLAGTR
jgi:integrase